LILHSLKKIEKVFHRIYFVTKIVSVVENQNCRKCPLIKKSKQELLGFLNPDF